jgi:hypothetical protein
MLCAGAEAADEQRGDEQQEARARPGQEVSDAGKRGPEPEHRRGAEPFRQQRRRNLERGHGAGIDAAQHPDLGIAEAEFALPDRQQHEDDVGEAVVQRVRPAGDAGRAPLNAAGG